MDCLGTYFTHVHIRFVFKVLCNGLPRFRLNTCPNHVIPFVFKVLWNGRLFRFTLLTCPNHLRTFLLEVLLNGPLRSPIVLKVWNRIWVAYRHIAWPSFCPRQLVPLPSASTVILWQPFWNATVSTLWIPRRFATVPTLTVHFSLGCFLDFHLQSPRDLTLQGCYVVILLTGVWSRRQLSTWLLDFSDLRLCLAFLFFCLWYLFLFFACNSKMFWLFWGLISSCGGGRAASF